MRKLTLSLSIAAHAEVAVMLFVAPLFATDVLPSVHTRPQWIEARVVPLPDVASPSRRTPPGTPPSATASPAPSSVPPVDSLPAPVEATAGIVLEQPTAGSGLNELRGIEAGGGGNVADGIRGIDGGGRGVEPPPLPAPPRAPVRVGGEVLRPRKVVDVAPVYPPLAMRAGISGTVLLEAVIAEDGRVTELRVLRSAPLLDQAAVDAVRRWVFSPTLLNGMPTPVVMTVTVTFSLR